MTKRCDRDQTKVCPASPDYRLDGQVVAKVSSNEFFKCCRVQEQLQAARHLSEKIKNRS